MKSAARWGVLAALVLQIFSVPSYGLDTEPSDPNAIKTNGPFLITGYSFRGKSLQYIQIFNSSSVVASLSGWRVAVDVSGSRQSYIELNGQLAPGKYITAADPIAISTPTFSWPSVLPVDPMLANVTLQAPAGSSINDETVTPSITSSTPRLAGTPATFFFGRNTSTSTGSYLSTFTAFVPTATFKVVSDGLYVTPPNPLLQITEIYPDAPSCSPNETEVICSDYIKLYNASAATVDLSQFRLRTGAYGQTASSSNTTLLSGQLASGRFTSFPISLNAGGNWTWLEDAYGTTRYNETIVQYPSNSYNDNSAWSYDTTSGSWRWTTILSPGDTPNQFPPLAIVNQCTGLQLSEIAANVASEDQFIEIYNPTTDSIDLSGCVLQTNRSSTLSFVFGDEKLGSNNFKTVFIKDTNLTLTKTTSGTVYVLSSDLTNEISQSSYNELAENSAWILDDGVWLQSYTLTPGASNIFTQYLPCEEGYVRNTESGRCNQVDEGETLADCGSGKYRSPETNRCRLLETSPSSLTSCASNQYRNPETNRCRSLVSTASVLTPCASNQERNPATNRCRLIGGGSLKPCTVNQERNPATNRCRNKPSDVIADFPVEAVTQTGEATIGWWAFGGVGTLAAGYAGWEWRRELLAAIKKVAQFIPGTR